MNRPVTPIAPPPPPSPATPIRSGNVRNPVIIEGTEHIRVAPNQWSTQKRPQQGGSRKAHKGSRKARKGSRKTHKAGRRGLKPRH